MKSSRVLIWAAVAVAIGAVAFAVSRSAAPPSGAVDNDALRRSVENGARLVDVRTVEEFELGHIPGAENVPVDELAQVAAGWGRDQAIVVYCATGARSMNAAQWLTGNGFTSVYDLTAGIVQWDGDLERGTGTVSKATVETNGMPTVLEFSSDG